jgi:hypothetical protein
VRIKLSGTAVFDLWANCSKVTKSMTLVAKLLNPVQSDSSIFNKRPRLNFYSFFAQWQSKEYDAEILKIRAR